MSHKVSEHTVATRICCGGPLMATTANLLQNLTAKNFGKSSASWE